MNDPKIDKVMPPHAEMKCNTETSTCMHKCMHENLFPEASWKVLFKFMYVLWEQPLLSTKGWLFKFWLEGTCDSIKQGWSYPLEQTYSFTNLQLVAMC